MTSFLLTGALAHALVLPPRPLVTAHPTMARRSCIATMAAEPERDVPTTTRDRSYYEGMLKSDLSFRSEENLDNVTREQRLMLAS